MLESFRYLQRFRVPFADIDRLQHVNHAAYIRWAEQIRCEYFKEILGEEIRGSRGIIMAKIEMTYEVPVAYRERVAIGCRVARIGTKSLDFSYEVWSDDRNLRCTHAVSTLVAIDYGTGATIVVPDDWRAKVAAFELPT
jgi:acyl-CoA thioester hydrolase